MKNRLAIGAFIASALLVVVAVAMFAKYRQATTA